MCKVKIWKTVFIPRLLSNTGLSRDMVGRIQCHILIPKPVNTLLSTAQGTLQMWFKLRLMRWRDYPGCCRWAQCNHKAPEREARASSQRRRSCDDGGRSWSDTIAKREPQTKECRQPLEAGKGKDTGFSLEPPRGTNSVFIPVRLILAFWHAELW